MLSLINRKEFHQEGVIQIERCYPNRNEGAYKLSHTWDKLLIPLTVKPQNAVKNTSKAKPATSQQPKAKQSV